jgi:tetratricopeptide (TPR) repeat protein
MHRPEPDPSGALNRGDPVDLHEPFLERATKSGAEKTNCALGAFLALRVVDRLAGLPADWREVSDQIQSALRYLQGLPPEFAEVGHLDNILRAAEAAHDTEQFEPLWSTLSTFANWLERRLQLGESLDVLETALRVSKGRDEAATVALFLHRGRVLRMAGRLTEATASYAAAGNMAKEYGDTHSELLSRIGRGIVLQKLGNLPGAEEILDEVRRDAEQLSDRDAEARANHDLAATYIRQDRAARAVIFAFRAFQLYHEPVQKERALSDLGVALQMLGHYSAARDAYELVLAGDLSLEVRLNTMLELLELAALTQDRVSFERLRREIEGADIELPPDARVDYEIKMGVSLASFGKCRKAERYLRRAIQDAEEYNLNDYLFRAEAALRELHSGQRPEVPPAGNVDWASRYPDVVAVADQLSALRVGTYVPEP